jgi:hypothetical protein
MMFSDFEWAGKKLVVAYFKLLLRHLPVMTDENLEIYWSGYSVSRAKFALEIQRKLRNFIAWGYLVGSFLRNLNVHFRV